MATMASRGEGIVAAAEQELRAARKQQWEEKAPERDAQAALVVPWRERIDASIARSRKVRGGNYVQIATVDEAGLPRCRTVVFRGWVPAAAPGGQGEAMKMITDARSEKAAHIASQPACEMVRAEGGREGVCVCLC
jgi:pyridoxine/pyridoxamine 5'-phosphate oxidase